MATLPFRGLATKGILHDPSPYQLDLEAWSDGRGMRFHASKAERAPIWREVEALLGFHPQFCAAVRPSSGYDQVFLAGQDGTVWSYANQTVTNVTPPARAAYTDTRSWTATQLGDVLYVNRPDGAPMYYGPQSTAFAPLPNMDSAWTCRSLRAYGDYLIALNVTKPPTYSLNGTNYVGGALPNLVKWSDLTLAGQVPDSWDFTDATKNAGENPLEKLTTPLVDGVGLKSMFVLYSENEVWAMAAVDDVSIFTFAPLFSDGGALAPNCVVEVDGHHYVFGPTDIYVHDGTNKQSIIDKRNRDYVYRNLNSRHPDVCFAAYMPKYNEVLFCYQSGDSDATFQGTPSCNKAAVYNIPADTWSFVDLPNIYGVTLANVDSVLTPATCANSITYATIGGTPYDQDNGYDQHVLAVSDSMTSVLTTPRLLAYDFMNRGSLVYPYVAECNAPAYLERTGLDLDQVGSDLTSYKRVRRIYPLVTTYDDVPVLVQVGSSLTPSGTVTWSSPLPIDPVQGYKVDIRKGGRYLALRFTVAQPADFEIAGFDADIVPAGRR